MKSAIRQGIAKTIQQRIAMVEDRPQTVHEAIDVQKMEIRSKGE